MVLRWLRIVVVLPLYIVAGTAAADAYSDGWGPAVGEQIPLLAALDQAGQEQTLATLAGKKGLLLFMNRSADW